MNCDLTEQLERMLHWNEGQLETRDKRGNESLIRIEVKAKVVTRPRTSTSEIMATNRAKNLTTAKVGR